MSTNPRLIVIALVALAVVGWGTVSGLAIPRIQQLSQLTQQASVATKKIDRLRHLASRKPAIEHAYEAYAEFRSKEPDALLQRILLDELEQLTQGQDLQLNLKPKPIQRDAHDTRVSVEVDVDAAQDTLLAFFDRLLTWPQLIELERVRIASGPSKQYPLRASLVIDKVVIRDERQPSTSSSGPTALLKSK